MRKQQRNKQTKETQAKENQQTQSRKRSRSKARPKNGNSSTPNNTTQTSSENVEVSEDVTAQNDPGWYNSNAALIRDAGSFSFNNPLGNAIKNVGTDRFAVPGVMAIRVNPCVGMSYDTSSVINMAAINIYSYVRHQNSGSCKYDSTDLMLYLLAVSEMHSYHAWLTRLYRICNSFQMENRYMPEALVKCQNVDYDDLIKHLADFRWYLNYLAEKIGQLAAPDSMSYFTRHCWMYTNIFADDPTAKASLYLYTPYCFYKYNEKSGDQGGYLEPVLCEKSGTQGVKTLLTLDDLMAMGNHLAAALVESEDIGIMSGDILKAFGASSLVKVGSVSPDEQLTPAFNLEVLSQFQNAILLGYPSAQTNRIYQDPNLNAVMYTPVFSNRQKFNADLAPYSRDLILNMYKNDPSPDDVVVATRLMVANDLDMSDASTLVPETLGSEFAVDASIYYFTFDSNGKRSLSSLNNITYSISAAPTAESLREILDLLVLMDKFNMHPMLQINCATTQGANNSWSDYKTVGLFGDLQNYTQITYRDLNKLHQSALLSEFNVPLMGAWSNNSSNS